jgi:hypothetical protein
LSANPRVDQCVASAGAVSKVSTTTASTTSSVTVRFAPGRGASHLTAPQTSGFFYNFTVVLVVVTIGGVHCGNIIIVI